MIAIINGIRVEYGPETAQKCVAFLDAFTDGDGDAEPP